MDDETEGRGHRALDRALAKARKVRNVRRVRITALIALLLLAVVYVGSLLHYQQGLQERFEPPVPGPNEVAVVLVPKDVDARAQVVTGYVMLYPGQKYLDGQGRLKSNIVVEISPSLGNGLILFPKGRKPTSSKLELSGAGAIQGYPFDRYVVESTVTTSLASTVGETSGPTLPQTVTTYFNVPGWALSDADVQNQIGNHAVFTGFIDRSVPAKIIALIFVGLILAFGIMAVVLVRSCFTGRYTIDLFVSSWMTAALFALITLRDKLPGNPPLGSAIDVAVYFWVVAVIMIMIVTALSFLLFGGNDSDDDADDDQGDRGEVGASSGRTPTNPDAAAVEAAQHHAHGTPERDRDEEPSIAAAGAPLRAGAGSTATTPQEPTGPS